MGAVAVSRRAAISKTTNTQYFRNVTPLWVPPAKQKIDKKYHGAINSLVEWIGPSWADTESRFFSIRTKLVDACDMWADYDWDSDASWIAERKDDARNLPALRASYRKFTATLNQAPFRYRKKMLGFAFLSEFSFEYDLEMTHTEFNAHVDSALNRFGLSLAVDDGAYTRFGSIEYSGFPSTLPRREVAISLSLADLITYWRNDGLQQGTLYCPHKPHISKNLPWKSIAEFAWANTDSEDKDINYTNVQTLVTSLSRKVALVHQRGGNS